MKKLQIFLLSVFCSVIQSYAQPSKNSPSDFGFTEINIKGSQDSIHFVVSDTNFDRNKPIFLIIQGSLANALFYKEDQSHTWQQFLPFSYKAYLPNYNFVVISKPGIPVFSHSADKNYIYKDPVSGKLPQAYFNNNYLDYYVTQANDVINYLVKQSNSTNKLRLIVFGHSQGSKVVAKLGAINKNVTEVIYLSGNPIGRFDQQIRQIRKNALLKKITSIEGQKQIDSLYNYWKTINTVPGDTKSNGGDTNKAQISFSEPSLQYLLQIKAPIFVGYGTADNTADYCDLLPIEFIRAGKENYTVKPYVDYDHNFFKLNSGGTPDGDTHWDDVAQDIFEWLKNH